MTTTLAANLDLFPQFGQYPGSPVGSKVVQHDGYDLYTVVSRTGRDYYITSNVVKADDSSFYYGSARCTSGYAGQFLGVGR